MNNDKYVQNEMIIELQYLDATIKQMDSQMIQIEEQINEINNTVASLNDLKDVKEGTEILVPIHTGIFAKAKIEKVEKLRVNVGAGIVAEKSVDDTIKMLQDQVKNVEDYRDQNFLQIQQMVARATEIQKSMIKE